LPNVQDEPRPWLARLVLLGARGVTAMVVGSGVLFGDWTLRSNTAPMKCDIFPWHTTDTFLFAETTHGNIRSSADEFPFTTGESPLPLRIAIWLWKTADIFLG